MTWSLTLPDQIVNKSISVVCYGMSYQYKQMFEMSEIFVFHSSYNKSLMTDFMRMNLTAFSHMS